MFAVWPCFPCPQCGFQKLQKRQRDPASLPASFKSLTSDSGYAISSQVGMKRNASKLPRQSFRLHVITCYYNSSRSPALQLHLHFHLTRSLSLSLISEADSISAALLVAGPSRRNDAGCVHDAANGSSLARRKDRRHAHLHGVGRGACRFENGALVAERGATVLALKQHQAVSASAPGAAR